LAPRRARTATLANSSLTVAERVLALASDACRWPCGDLGHPDFHFCGGMVARGPYCERHRAMAYLARPGRAHGFRMGFVTHGRLPTPVHDRPSTPGAFSAAGAARAPTSRAAFPVVHPRPLDREASPC
jgi:hypothetical protein